MESIVHPTGVAEVILNNPSRRNAFTLQLVQALGKFFRSAASDPAIRVVIIRSSSPQVFTAGLDLSLLKSIAADKNKYERIQELQTEFRSIYDFPKPVIVLISGFCIGAGVDLSCVCDLRYATDNATFSAKEIEFGIAPDLGTIPRMSWVSREDWTLEKLWTGAEFKAGEAKDAGLVTKWFREYGEMLEYAHELATKIAGKKSEAAQLIKAETRRNAGFSLADSLDRLARGNVSLL